MERGGGGRRVEAGWVGVAVGEAEVEGGENRDLSGERKTARQSGGVAEGVFEFRAECCYLSRGC